MLILHSYHQGRPWTDEIMRGMCQVLGKSGRRLSIHVEYMDLLRHPLDETRPALVRMLSAKYRYHQPDVILTSDTPAFDFMCGHGDLLFPGVPVVFCGVNEFLPSMLDGRPGFTGVAEQADLAGTLRLGLDLFPGATRIVAVADRNAATLARLGRLEQILRDEHPRLPFVSLAGLSARDTLTALAEQPASALVVYLALTQDREGEAVSPGVGLQLVRSACALPVLATADSLVAQGALGGSSVSPAQQGELAAAMALRVLAGQRPQDIPVLTRSLSRPVFNWSELQRLGISEDRLPAGSLVLNHPVPAEHRRFSVWSVLALTVSQLVTLGALFVMRRRHRRVSARQQRQYRYLRTLMDTIPAPIFFKGADGAFLGCNRAFERLSGRRQEELLGRPGEEGGPPQLADACARKDQEVLTTGRELAYEVRILDGEEREREMMVHKAPLLDAEGRATGLVAVMLDITERSRAEERLARREAHFRLLFQGMPLPTYIWRQGGGGFRLEGYNLAAEVIS
ncbi:MAG: ABC transporter substrate binding protein, partial [Desulfovibrionaceae bacterium]